MGDESHVVNMFEAKSNLSRLVEALETGAAREFVIARNGRPAARLVPLQEENTTIRLGLQDGRFDIPSLEEFNAGDEAIARLFLGEADAV